VRSRRVIVFLDFQNVYHRAREAFCGRDAPARDGQIDPLALGRALVRLVVSDVSGQVVTRSSTLPATTNAWHRVRISTRGLAPGAYRVALRVEDRAGNFQRGDGGAAHGAVARGGGRPRVLRPAPTGAEVRFPPPDADIAP
jgi:hypothetical protein